QDSRPHRSAGHPQEHRLSEVRQAHAYREARQRSRTRRPGRNLHFLLRLRILRKALAASPKLPETHTLMDYEKIMKMCEFYLAKAVASISCRIWSAMTGGSLAAVIGRPTTI